MKKLNKKFLIYALVAIIISTVLLSAVGYVVFDNGVAVLSNEKNYKDSGYYEDLYELCNSLYMTKRYKKILEYFPLLLEAEGFEENVNNDESWNYGKNESAQEIKSTFLVAYLNAYSEVNGADGLIDEMNLYTEYFYWDIGDNNTNSMFNSIVMFLHKNPKTLISVYDTDKGEMFLYTFKDFVDSTELSKSTKDFCDIFIKESLLLVNSYNSKRTLEIIGNYNGVDYNYYPGDEHSIPLIDGFYIINDKFEDKTYLGKKSYLDNVVIWVDGEVVSYFCDGKYICVEQKNTGSLDVCYYVIDIANDVVYGSYDLNEFNQKTQTLGLKVELTPV